MENYSTLIMIVSMTEFHMSRAEIGILQIRGIVHFLIKKHGSLYIYVEPSWI